MSNVRPPQSGNSQVGGRSSVGSPVPRERVPPCLWPLRGCVAGVLSLPVRSHRARGGAVSFGERSAWCSRKVHVLWSSLRSAGQLPWFPAASERYPLPSSPFVGRLVFHGQAANAKALHRFSIKPVQLACRTARRSGSSVAFSSTHPAEA
jgi:hypothetical protein